MKIYAIIPARGGSKGVPRKNIKEIAGKPLIAWSIESALSSKLIEKVYVSTEDEEITKISSDFGAEIITRPLELTDDFTPTVDVLTHFVECAKPDVVVLLQATSPIRSKNLIDECIGEFLENDYDSLATGFYCKYVEYGKNTLRRQDMNGFFYDDGNVYVIKSDILRKGDDRYGEKIGKKVISRWENVEIDDDFDFWLAEKILLEKR